EDQGRALGIGGHGRTSAAVDGSTLTEACRLVMRQRFGYRRTMDQEPDIEGFARTLGDPTRMKMLILLMEGRALTAKELAYGSGVEPATATAHLKRLLDDRLIAVAVQGRHKYVRLASPDVAQLIELMLAVAPRVALRRPQPRVEEK